MKLTACRKKSFLSLSVLHLGKNRTMSYFLNSLNASEMAKIVITIVNITCIMMTHFAGMFHVATVISE